MCKLFRRVKKKGEMKIKDSISLKNLYVGRLGRVTYSGKDIYTWHCLDFNSLIAFMYCSDKDCAHNYKSYGIDIFTNSVYFDFYGYTYTNELVGKIALNHCNPLSIFATEEEKAKGVITKDRVQEIIYYLNNPDKVKKKDEVSEDNVKDPTLWLIIESSKKIKNSNISEKNKTYLYGLLSELGKYYTGKLIEIKCSNNTDVKLELESPLKSLQIDVIEKLTVIESEINKALIAGNINHDYINFDEVLKRTLTKE